MPSSSSHDIRLRQGQSLQMQGRREEAAEIYRQVLTEDPQNMLALRLLELVTQAGPRRQAPQISAAASAQEALGRRLEQSGRRNEALAAYTSLIEVAPRYANGYAHRSRVLESLGRLAEALHDIEEAVALDDNPVLLLNRGVVLLQLQRHQDAIAAFDQAIAACGARPHPVSYFNRGVAQAALGRLQDALESYDAALQLQPGYGDAWVNRGVTLDGLGRMEEALASFDRALAVQPGAPEARANRLSLLARMGRKEEALAGLAAAIAAEPGNAMAWNNRGSVLNNIGELELALADFDRAVALQPGSAKLHSHCGTTLQALGRFEEALAAFDRAIALEPAIAGHRVDKSLVLLLLGRWAEGLPLYEWRARPAQPPGLDPAQAWAGPSQDVAGKTVLIHAEQGLGDVIMFSRYLVELSALGAQIVLAVRGSLTSLLQSLPVPVTFIPENARPQALDFHAPLLSLPMLFGTRVETIPAPVPYLKAEAARVERWRAHLGNHGFRVAVAWQGKISGTNDARRSFSAAALAPLAAIAGVRLISLQHGHGSEQLDELPAGMTVERLPDDFDTDGAFMDTAAVMEVCDLVVTPDTSIAHLAGALFRPVWTALKSVPEWRWLLEGVESPWYPTMRLYRQPAFGDWESVFAAMAGDLKARLAAQPR